MIAGVWEAWRQALYAEGSVGTAVLAAALESKVEAVNTVPEAVVEQHVLHALAVAHHHHTHLRHFPQSTHLQQPSREDTRLSIHTKQHFFLYHHYYHGKHSGQRLVISKEQLL